MRISDWSSDVCSSDLDPVNPLLHFHDHRLDDDDRIVDEQAERQDQRAERDPVEIAPGGEHDDEDTRKRERHGCRDDDTDAPTKAEQADQDYHDERDEEFQQDRKSTSLNSSH